MKPKNALRLPLNETPSSPSSSSSEEEEENSQEESEKESQEDKENSREESEKESKGEEEKYQEESEEQSQEESHEESTEESQESIKNSGKDDALVEKSDSREFKLASDAVDLCMQPTIESQNPTSEHLTEDREDGSRKATKRKRVDAKESMAVSISTGRVFTDDDVISILKGLKNYGQSNMKAEVCEILKGKLSRTFTKTQIYEKVRSLKKKFLNNQKRENQCRRKGKDFSFLTSHDAKVFKISKKIWGDIDSSTEANPKDGVGVDDDDEEENGEKDRVDFSSTYPLLMESFNLPEFSSMSQTLRDNIKLIGSKKAKELEMRWMQLQLKETEILSRKLNLKMELTKLVLDALKD